MRCGEFCSEFLLSRLRPLAIDEFEKIKADPDAVNADQIGDMLDVIDVTIHGALFFPGAHQHGIYADYAAAFADHLDLLIANVALDVVIAADICVRHDRRLCCNRKNFVKPGSVDVRNKSKSVRSGSIPSIVMSSAILSAPRAF